ncbi:hypothetical protein [Bythopirellula polymerisocia]|uniref:Preprotein translocase subunit SecD n=1 Tax=Bythopirellula polymerisocia TaxID=2528003 RepID=A0A5C6CHJ2_9BACT|nr:hypothetical protein [Bythopirellula polymerisocia]TWU23828.1 hypothetical protein Pla144_40040 [Bythopirellula polymerisocia]
MPNLKTSPIILLLLFSVSFIATDIARATEEASDSAEEFSLTYKFQLGEVLRYRVDHTADIRSTMEGTTEQAETKSDSIKSWKVTDVLPNGEMEFVHLVEVVRMSNRVPNRALVEFDSESDTSPPAGFEQVARAVGVPLSVIRITPSGEIVSREEKHPQPPVTDDMPITLRLPDAPVAVGEQWDESYDVPAESKSGAVTKVRTRRVCTLESVKNGIATISVEYQILTPVSAFVESNLVERLTKGTVRFDIEKGRIASQQHEVDRRILGFAGDSSVLHHVSRVKERLLKADERLARKPK